ncbi:hypothetical protein ABH989_006195 [Bradyrhizobium ottawaense]|uniref:hypothetical protein n=1 Tax=Bradyrhizobium ottawaense TaxID=931866 RepID=UPI0035194FB1
MMNRTAESLVAEFREEVHNKIPPLKAIVEGERGWLQATLSTPVQRNHSAVWWIRSAHLGTLEKLSTMLRRDGPYESLELLAIARNIFENLVWLRLMNRDRQFGIVFYAQLLRNQIESVQAVLRKVADEATLFDAFEGLDSDAMETKFLEGMKAARLPKEEVIREAIAAQKLQSDQLDDLMRREFSLYAGQATQNGYGFQAHLIRTKVIPEYESRLHELEGHKRLLDAELPTMIDAHHLGLASASKWNWFDRASDVRMDNQYRFLYSFTSKLLHAIPLNIITDKELSFSEMIMVLDYIVISAADILKAIRDFSYPGQTRVIDTE